MTYTYRSELLRVIDGDTVVLDVDLGFNVWLRYQSFRLLGVNAREKSDLGGPEAKAHLSGRLPVGTPLTLTSVKADKYGGRFDAVITLADGRDLAGELIRDGWAASWSGVGAKPLPPWPR